MKQYIRNIYSFRYAFIHSFTHSQKVNVNQLPGFISDSENTLVNKTKQKEVLPLCHMEDMKIHKHKPSNKEHSRDHKIGEELSGWLLWQGDIRAEIWRWKVPTLSISVFGAHGTSNEEPQGEDTWHFWKARKKIKMFRMWPASVRQCASSEFLTAELRIHSK